MDCATLQTFELPVPILRLFLPPAHHSFQRSSPAVPSVPGSRGEKLEFVLGGFSFLFSSLVHCSLFHCDSGFTSSFLLQIAFGEGG